MIEENRFVGIVNQRGSMVYKLAFVYMKSERDAEDIYRVVFERFLRQEPVFNDDNHEKRWFIVATVNACRALSSSLAGGGSVTSGDKGWTKVLSEHSKSNLTSEDNAVIEALLQLPEQDRVIMQLFYYEEYSVKEIARIMELKVGNVTTRLSRARKRMEKLLKGIAG